MQHPWLRSLLLALLVVLPACTERRRVPPPPLEQQQGFNTGAERRLARQREALIKQQRQERERCLRQRPKLEAQMAALRRAEAQLARIKAESYVPTQAPAPWDATRESRYRLEDREADWQRHIAQREKWQREEIGRRANWQRSHEQRLALAQQRLNQQAGELRSQRPDLFTGPGSIEFNPEVAGQIRRCEPLPT